MRDKRMAQLWGGRFTKETDKLVYNFNASLSFDSKLYKQDITGSMAHASMLAKQGIIEEQEEKPQLPEGIDLSKVGRNDPCPCGSGKKFKKCCGA